MKLRSFTIIAVAFTTAFIFSACSENSTTPDTAKNYYPLTVGSSWQYEKVALDTAGQDQGAPETYTMTSEHTTDTLGKTKATVRKKSPGGSEVFAQEGTVLYRYERPFTFALPNVIVAERWDNYVDFSSAATEWAIYDTTLTNVASTITIGGQDADIIINGKISVKGSRVGTETITVKGKTYTNCLKINRIIGSEFKVKTTLLGTQVEVPITASKNSVEWYANGVGLIKAETAAVIPRPDLSSIPAAFQATVRDGINGLIELGSRIELTASTVK